MNKRTFRLTAALGILSLAMISCGLTPTRQTPTPAAAIDASSLTIATSPEMSPLLSKLAEQFNDQQKANPGLVPVKIVSASPSEMVSAALNPDPAYQVINPDSGIWLSKLTTEWAQLASNDTSADQTLPIPRQRYALSNRFATSPIVIAMWQPVAQGLGWPKTAIRWSTLQEKASKDASFRWNHPSTDYASGLLATLAEFYSAVGVSRGLTETQVTQPATLETVRKIEETIRFYGEGESAILERLKTDGSSLLDAFVAQEQIVLRWNSENPSNRLIAVYPQDGTLWADHPMALIERYGDYDHTQLSLQQRDTYLEFSRFLEADDAQKQVLTTGYRPVSMNVDLQSAGSPFKGNSSVDPLQPQTTLQIPPYSVIQVIEDFREYIKKPTNVILVVDTSGSMNDSNKLPKAKAAITSFISNINGKKDRLGLITFNSNINYNSDLQAVTSDYKNRLLTQVKNTSAGGNTAILDAVLTALNELKANGDPAAINAIVVMTDGQENASQKTNQVSLVNLLSNSQPQVVVFSIAFGKDADTSIMKKLADATKGQFRTADSFNIEDLYKIISTYF